MATVVASGAASSLVIYIGAQGVSIGASLILLTTSDAVSVAIENAVEPPLTEVVASAPLVPLV